MHYGFFPLFVLAACCKMIHDRLYIKDAKNLWINWVQNIGVSVTEWFFFIRLPGSATGYKVLHFHASWRLKTYNMWFHFLSTHFILCGQVHTHQSHKLLCYPRFKIFMSKAQKQLFILTGGLKLKLPLTSIPPPPLKIWCKLFWRTQITI